MVQRRILYYPNILVPSRWLKWAIFYWDKASSIIPTKWEEKPVLKNAYDEKCYENMTYLREEGLFEPTRPEYSYPDNRGKKKQAHEKLLNELEEFLKFPSFMNNIRRNWTKNPMYRIHRDKMSYETLEVLEKSKLAVREQRDLDFVWFDVEKNTYLLYMALLAKNLADIDADYTVSSTDWAAYEDMVFQSKDKNSGFGALRTDFFDILPVPRDDVPIKEIVKFRKERRTELLDFREIIDEFQKEVSSSRDENEIKQTSLQHKEKIEKEREKLKESMKNFGIKTVFAAFSSLIDIKSPALAETIGFSLANVSPSITIPIVVGTAIIQIGYSWIDIRNEKTVKVRESPFSYLYSAEKKGII
jgi:hypothetical protein